MAKVTVEREYLGHNFKLTFESDIKDDLSAFQVEERIHGVMNRELQRFSEISAVAIRDKRNADELEQARRTAPEGQKVVDATVGRTRRLAVVSAEERGPSVVLGAGNKDVTSRFVVGSKAGRLLRSQPGAEVVAAEDEDGGNQ